jgi:hypothetical protein
MRQVLIDFARDWSAKMRGGGIVSSSHYCRTVSRGCVASIHGRLSSVDETSSFFEKVQLHFELTDLFVGLVQQVELIPSPLSGTPAPSTLLLLLIGLTGCTLWSARRACRA